MKPDVDRPADDEQDDEVRGEKEDAPRPDGDGDGDGTPPIGTKNETTTALGSADGDEDDRLVEEGTIPTTSALRDDDDDDEAPRLYDAHDDDDDEDEYDEEDEYDDDQLDEHDDQLDEHDDQLVDDDDDDAEGTILFEGGGASKSTPPLFSTVDDDDDGEDDDNRRRLFLSARNLEDLLQEHRANEGASYYPDPDDDDRGRDDHDPRVDDDDGNDHRDDDHDDDRDHDITPAEEEVRAELRKLSPHMFAGNAEMWRTRARRMGVRRITVAGDDRGRETTSAPALSCYVCAFRPRGVDDDDDDESFHEEYLRPPSSEFLRRVYAGFSRGNADAAAASVATTTDAEERVGRAVGCAAPASLLSRRRSSSPPPPREPVPLRTVALRVRPDALCGTVMDALSHVATTDRRGEMIKRQGGHVVAVVPGAWLRRRRRDAVDDDDRRRRRRRRRVFLPPLWLDAQLCTRRRGPPSRMYERTLLLRLYDLDDAPADDAAGEYTREFGKIRRDEVVKERYADPRDGLREAAHVVRRMVSAERDETREGEHDDDDVSDDDRASSSSPALWSKLLTSPTRLFHGHEPLRRSRSAFSDDAAPRREPFPSLSSDNDLFLEGSFRFLVALSSELDARGLSYDSLRASTFGAFPALPTLDAHYCSQTRLVCRERMLEDLLRAAADMERTAREAEARSAVFVRTLSAGSVHSTEPPSTPTPTPLTEYELDFEPPEASCPPWGRRVMEALQRIAAETSERNADAAAAAVASASRRSDDDEERGGADEEKKESPRVAVAATRRDGRPSDGFARAAAAVRSVVDAFTAQDDEERTARIDRKRRQVADRVARASASARETMIRKRDSYGCNAAATKAADHFHSMALRAKDLGACLDPDDDASSSSSSSSRRRRPAVSFAAPDQVPLLTCPVIVGEAAGTCYVTAHQILFATNHVAFLPTRKRVVSVSNLELVPGDPDPRGGRRLFRPPPEAALTIRLHKRLGRGEPTTTTTNDDGETTEEDIGFVSVVEEEVLSFVPSLGAERFKRFVDTVKSIGAENDDDDDDDR